MFQVVFFLFFARKKKNYSQIGRSSEDQIDCIVMDTVPGAKTFDEMNVLQSTISRYACRIVISRHPPYTARIYAAGFDDSKNIFLGVRRRVFFFFVCRSRNLFRLFSRKNRSNGKLIVKKWTASLQMEY